MLSFKQFLEQQSTNNVTPDTDVLFNFRWKQTKLDKLRALADERGVTASALVKNLLLHEFEREANKLKGA